MELSTLGLTGKKQEILNRNSIFTAEDLLRTMPRKYYYFDTTKKLEYTPELAQKIEEKEPVAIVGTCESVEEDYKKEKKMSLIKIKVTERESDRTLHVNFIGSYYKIDYFKYCVGKEVIIGGKLQYSEQYHSFSMLNPVVFSSKIEENRRIIPVYRKYKGISEEYYAGCINKLLAIATSEYLPLQLLDHYKLGEYRDIAKQIHHPSNIEAIESAKKRLIFDDMLYFACRIEENKRAKQRQTKYTIESRKTVDRLIKNQPFELTKSQQNAINGLTTSLINGRRINALVQGDVGTGKTIVAFAALVAAASAGYQCVMIAPTAVLAKQHYDALKKETDFLDINIEYLANSLTQKQKNTVLQKIEDGTAKIIVGTHSCISDSVKYNNLVLVVTDEEHKFGVLQREKLLDKMPDGAHIITMSGTPIPRTVATSLYGDSMQIYNLERPAERKPIITSCSSSGKDTTERLNEELRAGHQAYVVCPLITEAEEESSMEGVTSVEETFEGLKKYYERYGAVVECITGKTKKEEQAEIMDRFLSRKVHILVATTVIEVGINNPNATVIVITGAERFGAASLHQLRGRVGRGPAQSYCILQASPGHPISDNMRIVQSTNDGYEIAVEDMKNRGAGNILGEDQSGNNRFMELVYAYPKLFEKCKEIAGWFYGQKACEHFIKEYEDRYTTD